MGLFPLHIKRPSFIVVLNLMNTFVLVPDTLFNVEERNNSKTLNCANLLSKNIKDGAVFLLCCSGGLLFCSSFTS